MCVRFLCDGWAVEGCVGGTRSRERASVTCRLSLTSTSHTSVVASCVLLHATCSAGRVYFEIQYASRVAHIVRGVSGTRAPRARVVFVMLWTQLFSTEER